MVMANKITTPVVCNVSLRVGQTTRFASATESLPNVKKRLPGCKRHQRKTNSKSKDVEPVAHPRGEAVCENSDLDMVSMGKYVG